MTQLARHEEITGADLTGNDGELNRTYPLANSNSIAAQFNLMVAGAAWQMNTHYTKSGDTITFLLAVDDSSAIVIDYFSDTDLSSTSFDYATTLQLARFMHIAKDVPSGLDPKAERIKEEVGTGNDSNTLFYLDRGFVLAGSYTISYGATAAAAVSLTETTHYSINKDTGVITLTSAGVTLVSTNNIYAVYTYCSIELTDTQFQSALDRAQNRLEERTHTRWTDGTVATPSYGKITKETHRGKGHYDRAYYLGRYPLPSVETNLNGDLTAAATTITVDSTSGFPSTGTIAIESEKITYTGKTSTTFTGCTRGADDSTGATHDDDTVVSPFVFELSITSQGTTPTFEVLQPGSEYHLEKDIGMVHIYKTDIVLDSLTSSSAPPRGVPNRFRATYLHGHDEIPYDITQVVLMMASTNLMKMAVRKATSTGHNEFKPDMIYVDEAYIKETINYWKSLNSGNT